MLLVSARHEGMCKWADTAPLVNTTLDVVSGRLHVPATLPQGTQHPVPTEQGAPEPAERFGSRGEYPCWEENH